MDHMDHMVQNPPCWRASSSLFPHWDIINKGKSSLTGSGLFVLMSQWGNNNELALQHGGFLYHVIVSCKRPIETLKYLNSDWLRIVWFKCTVRSIRMWRYAGQFATTIFRAQNRTPCNMVLGTIFRATFDSVTYCKFLN